MLMRSLKQGAFFEDWKKAQICAKIKTEHIKEVVNVQYVIDGRLKRVEDDDKIVSRSTVRILDEEEYGKYYKAFEKTYKIYKKTPKIRHCRMDVFETCLIGTLSIPQKNNLEEEEKSLRVFLDRERLIFIGEKDYIEGFIRDIEEKQMVDVQTPAQAFFEFLDVMTDDEGEFIETYEDRLINKENSMLSDVNSIPKDIEEYLQMRRRELLIINRYYKQLTDVCEVACDCPNGIIDDRAERLFNFLRGRMQRLLADAVGLRDYTLQIRDMYQSRIDVRQNKIMQVLTIVTSTFMPLTLITGWYGMNFSKMPELSWEYGYIVVIILSILILSIEWIIFKKKKWF